MSIDIKCDKCKRYFEHEVYCPDCISELEVENKELKDMIRDLQQQIDKED